MLLRHSFVWLLLSLTGTTMAQTTTSRLADRNQRRQFDGLSHLEIELGRRNALIVGFDTFAQLSARQNVDSLLRLFVADYQRVADTTRSPVQPVRLLYRLSPDSRSLDVRSAPQPATTFRFNGGQSAPVLVKTRQDTLQLVWTSEVRPYYPFTMYVLVNNFSDIDQLLQAGGINRAVQAALDAVRGYKAHDLTNPRMAFHLTLDQAGKATFREPGLAKATFISLQPNIGVGLIRNQWVPSLQATVEFVPSRFRGVGYTAGYLSNFFFTAADGRTAVQRTDFLTVGVSFYKRDHARGQADFSRLRTSLSVGFPVYRRGDFFAPNAVRLSSTIPIKGFVRLQPELYMNGLFRQVFPGLRLAIGL